MSAFQPTLQRIKRAFFRQSGLACAVCLGLMLASCGGSTTPVSTDGTPGFSGKLSALKTEALLVGPDWRELKEANDGAGAAGDTAVEETFSKRFQNLTTKSTVFVSVLKFKSAEVAKHSYQELISSGKPPVNAVQFDGYEAHDIPGRSHRYILIGQYWLMASQNPSGTDHITALQLLMKQMGFTKR